jgi:DNA-binding NtrC family response regulator
LRHTLRKLCAARGLPLPAVSQDLLHLLLNYDFPGNVRELENIVEHVLILGGSGPLQERHLPDYLRFGRESTGSAGSEPAPEGEFLDEGRRIAAMLKRFKGHRGKTAQALGIERTTLWRKMKRHALKS